MRYVVCYSLSEKRGDGFNFEAVLTKRHFDGKGYLGHSWKQNLNGWKNRGSFKDEVLIFDTHAEAKRVAIELMLRKADIKDAWIEELPE